MGGGVARAGEAGQGVWGGGVLEPRQEGVGEGGGFREPAELFCGQGVKKIFGGSVGRLGVDVRFWCCAYVPIVESFSTSTVPAYASPPPMGAVMDDGSGE